MRASLGRLSPRGRFGIGVAVAALALVIVSVVAGAPAATSRQPAVLPVAKSFSLPALGRSGQWVSLSHYPGRPVIVNFFASWCAPCQKETPLLARFYRARHGQVIIVGVDVNDGTPAAARFASRAGISYPVGTDSAGATAVSYGVPALPVTFFLNAAHRVVKTVFGPVTLTVLNAGLARMR